MTCAFAMAQVKTPQGLHLPSSPIIPIEVLFMKALVKLLLFFLGSNLPSMRHVSGIRFAQNHPMNTSIFLRCAAVALFSSFSVASLLQAQDAPKSDADKARELMRKLVDAAEKASGKVESKAKELESKTKDLWAHTKENLRMSKEDYLARANAGLLTMQAEVQGLAEADTGVAGRDYFKTRVAALKQQVDYCRHELDKLKDIPNEETFRVKQKGFDRTMGFLSDNIGVAKDEAGL